MKVTYRVHEAFWGNEWVVEYICNGSPDYDIRGTYGTGCKIFPTEAQAEASGKRYVKKMVANGFEDGTK